MSTINPKRIVFLCSGGGGNFYFIHQAIKHGWISNAKIVAIITDKPCPANNLADFLGISNQHIDFKQEDQHDLLQALEDLSPDLIITTVHKILLNPITQKFSGKLINLHYSLLPSFKGIIGTRPVKNALAYGAKLLGVTVHFVDESLDEGKPILQAAIALGADNESIEPLMDTVFRCGAIALLEATKFCIEDKYGGQANTLEILQKKCLFSSISPSVPDTLFCDAFWHDLSKEVSKFKSL